MYKFSTCIEVPGEITRNIHIICPEDDDETAQGMIDEGFLMVFDNRIKD